MRSDHVVALGIGLLSAAGLLTGCDTTAEPVPLAPTTSAPQRPPAPPPEAQADHDAAPPATPPVAAPERRPPPDAILPFDDVQTLADVLAAAEEALADPGTPDPDRTQWAWAHQQAYRDLVANTAWQDAVRSEIPEELTAAFDLTLQAGTELRELTSPQPGAPTAWRILSPPPLDDLRGYYDEAEATFGVPWNVLAAIHLVETRFGRIHGDSYAGAQGPMQFMPRTWEAYGEGDVRDPRDAILAAGRYLAASGAPGDLRRALFAYNRSDHYVEAILAHAQAMERYEHYLDVYYRWRVYYRTVDGDLVLPEGYGT